MSKLTTDAPHDLNINQVTNDVIILYNDDGTKVIMVLENGRWLQAKWLQARTESTQKEKTKNQPNKKTYHIERESMWSGEQPHPKAYKKDTSPTWYIDIESLEEFSKLGGEHSIVSSDGWLSIRDGNGK